MRKVVRALLSVGVLGLAVPMGVAGQSESTRAPVELMQGARAARASYQKAVELFNKNEYAQAREELATCLKRMPTFSGAHLLLAKALYIQKEYPAALTEVELAKATHAESVALSQAIRDDRDDELRRRRRELEAQITPLRVDIRGNATQQANRQQQATVARLEATISDIDRELSESQRTPPATVPAEYFFFHGNVLLRLQRADEAVAEYRKALEARPLFPEASNNLASLYLSANRPELALEVLEQAESKGAAVNPKLKQAVLEAMKK